jgi:hypothetical protein
VAATIKWIYRGSSNTQAYYASGLRDMTRLDSGSTAPAVISGPAGSFGNLLQTSNAVYNLEWPGQDNGPIGKAGFTIGWSGNSSFTGSVSSSRGGMFTIGCTRSQRGYWGGISIYIDSAGKVRIGCGSRSNGGNYFNGVAFNYVINFTQNTIKEIYVTWDGTTAANGAKLWVCDRGSVPVNVASLTASAANTELWNRAAMASFSSSNVADFVNTIQADIEEIFILDEAVDVAAYFGGVARTTYLASPTGSEYEGYNHTSLSVDKVRLSEAFGPGPGTLTGTLAVPTASQVLNGVAVGSTTGNVIQAAVSDVRKNTTYGPSSSLTGLAYIPAASDVLSGVNTDQTTGTAIAALAVSTKIGISANDGAGSYDGTDRHTHPDVAEVAEGVVWKENSLINNRTGTLVVADLGPDIDGLRVDIDDGEILIEIDDGEILAEIEDDEIYLAIEEQR